MKLALLALVFACHCRPKAKLSALDYIAADAPGVVWLPNPKQSLEALQKTLAVFEREPVGDQLKAWRFDIGHQLGIDVFDPRSLTGLGVDIERPLAVVVDAGFEPRVLIVPAVDAEQLMSKLVELCKQRYGALEEKRLRKDGVGLSEVLGGVKLELLALRAVERAVIITEGDGAATRLDAYPTAEELRDKPYPHTFTQYRKKSEADGTPRGAVARAQFRDVGQLVPAAFRSPDPKKATELHAAVYLENGKLEIEAAIMGLDENKLHHLSEPLATHPPFRGLPAHPLVLARSDVDAATLFDLARQTPGLRSVVGLAEDTYGKEHVERFTTLVTGAGAAAIEAGSLDTLAPLQDGKKSPREQLLRLLDLFPISATFDLRDDKAYDETLTKLSKWLQNQQQQVVLDSKSDHVVLRGKSPTGSQVALGRLGKTALYGIGPSVYQNLESTVVKDDSGPSAAEPFAPLFAPHTSGVVVNTALLVPIVEKVVNAIIGKENPMVRTLVGRSLQSLKHFKHAGVTLMFEGPTVGPHPIVRAWLQIE